jgi:hypothetical protein
MRMAMFLRANVLTQTEAQKMPERQRGGGAASFKPMFSL